MNLLTFSSSTVNNEWVCSIDMRNLNFVYSQFKHIVFVCCDFYKDQIIWIVVNYYRKPVNSNGVHLLFLAIVMGRVFVVSYRGVWKRIYSQ